MNYPDNYSLWEQHEARQERQLRSRPMCACCGEYIQSEVLWDFDGTLYCDRCAVEEFRKHTEDYMD